MPPPRSIRTALAVDAFKKEVEAASGGKLTIENLPNYTGGDAQLFDDVVGGAIEMGAVSTATWDTKGSNVFQALQAPFLITDYGLAQTVEGGPIGTAMLTSPNGPPKFKLVGLGIIEGGLRKPLGRTVALTNPAAFKGKKIRVAQSKVLAATITALGAKPVALPIGDVFTALENGTVDGMEAEPRPDRDEQVLRGRGLRDPGRQPVAVPGCGRHQQGSSGTS